MSVEGLYYYSLVRFLEYKVEDLVGVFLYLRFSWGETFLEENLHDA